MHYHTTLFQHNRRQDMKTKNRVFALLVSIFILFSGKAVSFAISENGPVNPDKGQTKQSSPLRILDIGERTYKGGPAISIIVSSPLDTSVRHDAHFRVSDPKTVLKDAWVVSDDGRILYFPHVEPETEYTVTVFPSLADKKGNHLEKRVVETVKTRKIEPAVSFSGNGFLLPRGLTRGIPVATVNVPEVEIEFFRMNEKGMLKYVQWNKTTRPMDIYRLDDVREYGDLVFSGRFDLNAPKNRRVVTHIPVETIEELQKEGVYLAVMREPGEYEYRYDASFFLVTDLAFHMRIYKEETRIFLSSLKTGKPVPDAALIFHRNKKNPVKGKTDENGEYRYTGAKDFSLVEAKKDGMLGVLPVNLPQIDMSEFDTGKRKQHNFGVFTYGPRDLYRPGEKVIVSALLRDYDGRPVTSRPVTAKLFRPDGKQMQSFIWHPESLPGQENINYYQKEINLSKSAQTGKWRLRVYTDPADREPATEYSFHVEEFLPERMKLDLALVPDKPYPDTDLILRAEGEYLYGAPAAGNDMETRVRVQPEREIFEKWEGFQFGNIQDATYRDQYELEKIRMDDNGKAEIKIESRWEGIKSPLTVRVTASLFESGGRPVTRAVEATTFPGPSLVGIRPLFDNNQVDNEGPVEFELICADKNGVLQPGKNLLYGLIREDRDYYWEYNETSGWDYKYTEKNYPYETGSLSTDGEKSVSLGFNLKSGAYVLRVGDPETELETSIRFHVGYAWWLDDDEASRARPDKVTLILDRPQYQPGDIISLQVTPPHEGSGLILVECTDKPLWWTRVPVSPKGTTVEIPVAGSWDRHDMYISAIVFRPGEAEEKITPNRAVGLIHLPLYRENREIGLSIEAPRKMLPSSPLEAVVKMVTPTKEPVFVTLAAVDVGILNITDFQTPDPFSWFFAKRRFSVSAYDIYNRVIEFYEGEVAGLRFGGDADITGGKRPETEIRLVSLFHEPVQLDAKGVARIKLDVPDFNGRLRLMALAFGKDSYGACEAETTVASPVVTQLSHPRFLAAGDTSIFTLDVHNLSGTEQNLELELTASPPIALSEGSKKITLKDQEKTTLTFPVKAMDTFGPSGIELRLSGRDITIKRDWQVGVRPAWPAIAEKTRRVLKKSEEFQAHRKEIQDLIPDTLDASLVISPVLPLEMGHLLKGLIGYPYGCLEQTTSMAWPLLYSTEERVKQHGLKRVSQEERVRRIEGAINKISTMQIPSGGFGLWSGRSPEAPWLTVYVTEFMIRARENGFYIPQEMLDKALKRIELYLKRTPPTPRYMDNTYRQSLEFAVRAYSGYVLSLLNQASLSDLRTLFDNHFEKASSNLPFAHLAVAFKRMGDARRSKTAFDLAAKTRRDEKWYWGDYGSSLRDTAKTLAVMLENDKDADVETLFLDLNDAVYKRRWLSTQEKFSLFALGMAMENLSQKDWKGELFIGGKKHSLQTSGKHTISLSVADFMAGIRFVSQTDGILYLSMVVEGYGKNPPQKAEEGISLFREFLTIEGKPVKDMEFHVGEPVLVHIRADAGSLIPDALVADLLPAGFELENQNLAHSMKIDDIMIDGKPIRNIRTETTHEEFRDDRYAAFLGLGRYNSAHLFYLVRAVTPGVFITPPTLAESMYKPEIRGVGDTPPPVSVINENTK